MSRSRITWSQTKMAVQAYLLFFVYAVFYPRTVSSPIIEKKACTCSDPSLCKPVDVPPRPELVAFTTDSALQWKLYNYTYITTLAMFGNLTLDPQMVCAAHERKIRVLLPATFDSSQINSSSYRQTWVKEQVDKVTSSYTDGINLDFEGPIPSGSSLNADFVSMVAELKMQLKAAFPGSQLSIDVAWSPACVDGRCFDHLGLSQHVDYMVLMAYDESSQVLGPCIAMANSPLLKTMQGALGFIETGIPREKLVVGLPWYGYDYTCESLTSAGECTISEVPFRGIQCSDAAGHQKSFFAITDLLKQSFTGRVWNTTFKTPFFNYKGPDGHIHQVWYDDPESLGIKYFNIAKSKLGGVGVWTTDSVDYKDPSQSDNTKAMWAALDEYFKNII